MAAIDSLTQQHEEILLLLKELADHQSDRDIKDNAKGLSLTLRQLSGKFYFHLLAEERVLYLPLLSHKNESVQETCRQYSAEMDVIVRSFRKYRGAYSSAIKIFQRPAKFRHNTAMVAKTFIQRFADERLVLYPIVERLYQIHV